jgi:hypothetical protein
MEIQNRNKDLTQVFDQRWKANHDYDSVKKAREQEKKFTDKMFNVKNNTNVPNISNSVEERVNRLNQNIGFVRDSYNRNRNIK